MITSTPLVSCSNKRESFNAVSRDRSPAFSMIRQPPATFFSNAATSFWLRTDASILPFGFPVSFCNALIILVASTVLPLPEPPCMIIFPVPAVAPFVRCWDAPVSAWQSCSSIPVIGTKYVKISLNSLESLLIVSGTSNASGSAMAGRISSAVSSFPRSKSPGSSISGNSSFSTDSFAIWRAVSAKIAASTSSADVPASIVSSASANASGIAISGSSSSAINSCTPAATTFCAASSAATPAFAMLDRTKSIMR